MESKQKEEDAEYAYTPKEGFNWDNVSGAINDVIWTNGKHSYQRLAKNYLRI